MALRKNVTLNVNKDFYDKVFQREKAKYAAKIGMPIHKFSNTQFTAFLAQKQVEFKLPPMKNLNPIKRKKGLWLI